MANVLMDPKVLPGPKTEWRGGPKAIGRVGRKEASWKDCSIQLSNPIPGYTGRNRRMPTEVGWNDGKVRYNRNMPFATDESYSKASPRIKTNSKNVSAFAMGDNRCRYWTTTNEELIQLPDGYEEKCGQSIVEDWEHKTEDERKAFYQHAIGHVGLPGVKRMFDMVRAKIDQRTTGGPFVLRQAFKLFDKDASGDIDPDEFYAAMEWMGLQFTELQVIALFGMCDDDGGGVLDYFEFIEKVLDGIACRPQSAAKRQFPNAVHVYRQQLAMGDLFSQIEKMEKGSNFEVDRETIKELLEMANVAKCTHAELEAYVDLVADSIQLLVQGSLSRADFWNWWTGKAAISGLADFPAKFDMESFDSVKSKTMTNKMKMQPTPPSGVPPVDIGRSSKKKATEAATFRRYDVQPPAPPSFAHKSGAMTSRHTKHRFINGHESYGRKRPEGVLLPALTSRLRKTVCSDYTARQAQGGYTIASNPF